MVKWIAKRMPPGWIEHPTFALRTSATLLPLSHKGGNFRLADHYANPVSILKGNAFDCIDPGFSKMLGGLSAKPRCYGCANINRNTSLRGVHNLSI